MRILRGDIRGIQVTAFLALVLVTSSLIVFSSPRPTHAEGPLLGGARCLLQALLLGRCTTDSSKPSTSSPVSPSTNSLAPGQSGSGGDASSAGRAPSNSSRPYIPPAGAEVPLPDTTIASYPKLEQLTARRPSNAKMDQSEYLAYFNAYSPYAVQRTSEEQVVVRTSDGWRLLGISWYWWGAAVVAGLAILLSVRRRFLRKSSVLSKSA